MILDYLKERFTSDDFYPLTMAQAAAIYPKANAELGREILMTDAGFVTYELRGDALLIHDIFVLKEKRHSGEGQALEKAVIDLAKAEGKTVSIGYSGIAGKNHQTGIQAMKDAGYEPYLKLSHRINFIKGI